MPHLHPVSCALMLGVLLQSFGLFSAAVGAKHSLAYGENHAHLSNSGFLVPLENSTASIRAATVDISIPRNQLTHVRVEITFPSEKADRSIVVGLPTEAARYWSRTGAVRYPVSIKLDDKPVGYTFLPYDALVESYLRPVRSRIDKELAKKPELDVVVRRLRSQKPGPFTTHENDVNRMYSGPSGYLADWMAHRFGGNHLDWDSIAGGLLDRIPEHMGGLRERFDQRALEWLDPSYKPREFWSMIRGDWGFEPKMLNPWTGRTEDVSDEMIYPEEAFAASFGVAQFKLTLAPVSEHRLIVDYDQPRSSLYQEYQGLGYIFPAAKKWSKCGKLTVRVHLPSTWKKAQVSPKPSARSSGGGRTNYVWRLPTVNPPNVYVGF